MSTGIRFDKFLSNLSLTQPQVSDAYTKIYSVGKKLHDHYYPWSTYDGSTILLVGSYGKETNIRPPRDVDVLFKLPAEKFTNGTPYYNYQANLLQEVKDILVERYPNTQIRSSTPVIMVNFGLGHFIEVVPSIEMKDGSFAIPRSNDGGYWHFDHPVQLIKHIDESDTNTGGNTRKLIKMIKCWQEYCLVPISTLTIELRAVKFLSTYQYSSESSFFFDWIIRDYFGQLLSFVDGSHILPGSSEKYYYGSQWQSKAQTAYNRAVKACEYESAKDYTNATNEWKKIFGDDFEHIYTPY